jgi:predicted enzyme related to lactoylglutathione lyase
MDCLDPEALAPFWAQVLGTEIDAQLGEPPQFINLAPAETGAPRVCMQRVPEIKIGKNRVHLDLLVDDVDVASTRIETLGGRRRDEQDFHEHGYSWRRMADPEGNEFCLIYDV